MVKGRLTKQEKIFIQSEYDKGKSVKEVSDTLGRPLDTILKFLNGPSTTKKEKDVPKVTATGRPFQNDYVDTGGFEKDREFDKKVWNGNIPTERVRKAEKVNCICTVCNRTFKVKPGLIFNGRYTCNECVIKK